MIEVLITFVVLLVGLLGLIGLQARTQQAELESYQRGQALVLLQDMVDRMNANRTRIEEWRVHDGNDDAAGRRHRGGRLHAGGRGRGARQMRVGQFAEWRGGTRHRRPNLIGAMLGATRLRRLRTIASELPDSSGTAIAGTGIHRITVAWQGVSKGATALAANLCGEDLYPSRRSAPHSSPRRCASAR